MKKARAKILVDLALTVVLLLLMTFEMIGAAAHEWLGIGMFFLVIVHHILNWKWSKNLFRGRYTAYRIAQTVLVFLVLLTILGAAYSGAVLSRHALRFLDMQNKGCFTGNELTLDDMMNTMFAMMGIDPERIEMMSTMDPTAMINQMYYTVMALLPMIILLVFLGNSLVVDQVDRGSMAYVLSTPTRRSAVTGIQTFFMVIVPFIVLAIVCATRIATTKAFFGEVNVPGMLALFGGMYILVEAMAAICYMGSCILGRTSFVT